MSADDLPERRRWPRKPVRYGFWLDGVMYISLYGQYIPPPGSDEWIEVIGVLG